MVGLFKNLEEQALENSRRKLRKMLSGMTLMGLELIKDYILQSIELHWYVRRGVLLQKRMGQLIGTYNGITS